MSTFPLSRNGWDTVGQMGQGRSEVEDNSANPSSESTHADTIFPRCDGEGCGYCAEAVL